MIYSADFPPPDQSLLPGVSVFRYVWRQARFACPLSELHPASLFSKEVPPSDASHWTRNRPGVGVFRSDWLRPLFVDKWEQTWWRGVRWNSRCEGKEGSKKKKEKFVRIFRNDFSIHTHFNQRKLLTRETNTWENEEPQISTEKARSNHHSK